MGRRRPDVRTLDALPRGGARAVDLAGHLLGLRNAPPGAVRRHGPPARAGARPAAGRLRDPRRHRRDRLRRVAARRRHDRGGETRRDQRFRADQGPRRGTAGRRDERLLRTGPRRRGPDQGRGRGAGRRSALRGASGHPARHPGRLPDQCRLLHLAERPQPHRRRVFRRAGFGAGQQPAVLCFGRRAVVLAVLRPGDGQELPHRIARHSGLLVEHPDVATSSSRTSGASCSKSGKAATAARWRRSPPDLRSCSSRSSSLRYSNK